MLFINFLRRNKLRLNKLDCIDIFNLLIGVRK